jgi:REP element-mobilizing transposase RayT
MHQKKKQYRLPYFNYASSGLYFVTICTHDRKHLFGTIKNGIFEKSRFGLIVEQCWDNIPRSSPYAGTDEFVIMPDHIHGIIEIKNPDEPREMKELRFDPGRRTLSIVVRNFKAAVSIQCREMDAGIIVWQSRFYDRIIRNEGELNRIRKYIQDNPLQWEVDKDDKNDGLEVLA